MFNLVMSVRKLIAQGLNVMEAIEFVQDEFSLNYNDKEELLKQFNLKEC
jgi:uncharacterized protein YoaH (UPF0181 family)